MIHHSVYRRGTTVNDVNMMFRSFSPCVENSFTFYVFISLVWLKSLSFYYRLVVDGVSILSYVTLQINDLFVWLSYISFVLVVLWWTHGMQLVDDEMVKWETKSPFIESNVLYIAWLWRWSCGLFLTLRGWLKPQERCVRACVQTRAPEKQTERLSLKNMQFRVWH